MYSNNSKFIFADRLYDGPCNFNCYDIYKNVSQLFSGKNDVYFLLIMYMLILFTVFSVVLTNMNVDDGLTDDNVNVNDLHIIVK